MRTEGSYDIGKLTANRNCEKRLFNKFWGGNPIASAVGAVKIDTIEQVVLGRIVWKKQGAGFYHYGVELVVDDAVSQTIIEELKLYVRNHEEGKGVGQN